MAECLYVSFLLFCVSHMPMSLDKWRVVLIGVLWCSLIPSLFDSLRASTSVLLNFLSILHEKTYFSYFTHSLLQNTHISLSILEDILIKYSFFSICFIISLNYLFTYMRSLSLSPHFSDLLLSLYLHLYTSQISIDSFTPQTRPNLQTRPISIPGQISSKHRSPSINLQASTDLQASIYKQALISKQWSTSTNLRASISKHRSPSIDLQALISSKHRSTSKHRSLSTDLQQDPLLLGQAQTKQDPQTLIIPVKHRSFHKHRSFQSSTDLSLCWFVYVGLFVCGCVCVLIWLCGCVCVHLRKKRWGAEVVVHGEEREKLVWTEINKIINTHATVTV